MGVIRSSPDCPSITSIRPERKIVLALRPVIHSGLRQRLLLSFTEVAFSFILDTSARVNRPGVKVIWLLMSYVASILEITARGL